MKTATELLQEILANQQSLDKKADTTVFLLTTLISRFDQLVSNFDKNQLKKPEQKKPPTIEQGNLPAPKKSEELKQSPPTTVLPNTKNDAVIPTIANSISEEKFAIVQQIKRKDIGIWLCKVIITNSSGQIVYDGNTARNGQWTTVLSTGNYTLSITRGAGNESAEINISDTFNVSAAKVKNGKITLPEIKI